MAERIVTGVRKIDRKLKKLPRRPANRVARAGLTKGARLAAKLIKGKIPSRLKSVRAAIGHSVKKSKDGVTKAKAGAAVGKSRRKKPPKKSSSKGVGISRNNVHWWLLGTTERHHKSGRGTGKMPANGVVKQAMAGGLIQVRQAIIDGAAKKMKSELVKL